MSRLSRLTRSFTAPTIDSSTTNIIVEHRVPIVITSLGARPEINDAVHSYGGIVLHDVTNNEFARKAIDKGADGIIAVAAGAGGHAGTQSPLALIREIGEWFDGPLLMSGGHRSRPIYSRRSGGRRRFCLHRLGFPFDGRSGYRSGSSFETAVQHKW